MKLQFWAYGPIRSDLHKVAFLLSFLSRIATPRITTSWHSDDGTFANSLTPKGIATRPE
jgi:hypothetical protein